MFSCFPRIEPLQQFFLAETCPLMINAIVASRAPPTLVITFNRAVCLSDCAHVSVKLGDSPLADIAWSMSTGETSNDKPANMWVCPLSDKVTDDSNVKIELRHNQQCVTLQLEPGEFTELCTYISNTSTQFFDLLCFIV